MREAPSPGSTNLSHDEQPGASESGVTDSRIASPFDQQHVLLTLGLVLTVAAVAFETLAIATVLPAVVEELGGLHLYGWAFSAFLLTQLVAIVVAGLVADQRGPGLPFAIGVVLFAAGLLVGGLASSMIHAHRRARLAGIGRRRHQCHCVRRHWAWLPGGSATPDAGLAVHCLGCARIGWPRAFRRDCRGFRLARRVPRVGAVAPPDRFAGIPAVARHARRDARAGCAGAHDERAGAGWRGGALPGRPGRWAVKLLA